MTTKPMQGDKPVYDTSDGTYTETLYKRPDGSQYFIVTTIRSGDVKRKEAKRND